MSDGDDMNPLDSDQPFAFEAMNPNCTFRDGKDGPIYRISLELAREDWDQFVAAEKKGMILAIQAVVTERNTEVTEIAEKKKGGPKSREAAFLCQEPDFDEWADKQLQAKYGIYDSHVPELGRVLIYTACNISSRAELDHNPQAYETFKKIERAFHQRGKT